MYAYHHSTHQLSVPRVLFAWTFLLPMITYSVFSLLSTVFDKITTTVLGLTLFWIIGIGSTSYIIGFNKFSSIIKFNRPSPLVAGLIIGIISIFTLGAATIEINTITMLLVWVYIGLGDGIAHEYIWRGVYYIEFKEKLLQYYVFSAVGSVMFGWLMNSYMIIPMDFFTLAVGLVGYSSIQCFLTIKTKSAFWSIFTHSFLAIFTLFV